jgi:hypothetical protein
VLGAVAPALDFVRDEEREEVGGRAFFCGPLPVRHRLCVYGEAYRVLGERVPVAPSL